MSFEQMLKEKVADSIKSGGTEMKRPLTPIKTTNIPLTPIKEINVPIKKRFQKLVICKSRELQFDELILLNKCFSVLTFNHEFHGNKAAEDLMFECIIIDFMSKPGVSWFLRNKRYLKDNCNVINLQLKKKHLSNDKITELKKTFGFDSVIKTVCNEFGEKVCQTANELLSELLVDHQSIPNNDICSKLYRCLQDNKKKKK